MAFFTPKKQDSTEANFVEMLDEVGIIRIFKSSTGKIYEILSKGKGFKKWLKKYRDAFHDPNFEWKRIKFVKAS